jgi:histidine triad (HIT) family protein
MPHDPDCIFCKIVAGEVPCRSVLDTEHCLAFLDIGPIARGHTLIIPKQHAATLDAVAPDAAADLGRHLPALCRAVAAATGTPHSNVLQNNGAPAGQAVMHVHFHVIPRHGGDSRVGSGGEGLEYNWPAGTLDDADALQQAIRDRLGRD